jgi:hypothetical protein
MNAQNAIRKDLAEYIKELLTECALYVGAIRSQIINLVYLINKQSSLLWWLVVRERCVARADNKR